MSGEEIKKYVLNKDDIYYNIVILDKNQKELSFNEIDNNVLYDFEKIYDIVIGCGMVTAYYSIKKSC
jgi:5'(3')-deoxyribonucleotidase